MGPKCSKWTHLTFSYIMVKLLAIEKDNMQIKYYNINLPLRNETYPVLIGAIDKEQDFFEKKCG